MCVQGDVLYSIYTPVAGYLPFTQTHVYYALAVCSVRGLTVPLVYCNRACTIVVVYVIGAVPAS